VDGLPPEARDEVGLRIDTRGPLHRLRMPAAARRAPLDADGRAVLFGLPDYSFVVVPQGEGWAFAPSYLEAPPGSSGPLVMVARRPHLLRGVLVTPDGRGVAGERIAAAGGTATAVSAGDGTFELRVPGQPGDWTVLELVGSRRMFRDVPEHSAPWRAPFAFTFDPDRPLVAVVVPAHFVTGTVVDAAGRPAAWREVYVEAAHGTALPRGMGPSSWPEDDDRPVAAVCATDGDGRFVAAVAPEHDDLRVTVHGEAGFGRSATIPAGAEFTDVGTIALEPTGAVAGTVRDARGRPVPGAMVWVTGTRMHQAGVTDARGRYRFAGIRAGRVRVVAEHDFAQTAPLEVPITSGTAANADLVVERAMHE
jgi:hypothetical protein